MDYLFTKNLSSLKLGRLKVPSLLVAAPDPNGGPLGRGSARPSRGRSALPASRLRRPRSCLESIEGTQLMLTPD